jgi:16S rRNA (adenine1518-N6/adenine1519-N6)-dimethyltransferase
VRTRKRFGQHFLERAWAARLVEAIGPQATDVFLEIGSGRGALTHPLAARAGRVIAVEVDRDLAAGLARATPPNVTIVAADILSADVASLLASIAPPSAAGATPPLSPGLRVVGNLPYNISSPILFRLLALARSGFPVLDATLMLQREVADRVLAAPDHRDYGVLAVLVQLRAQVERVFTLPPGAFRPPPAVRSSVVRLTFHPPEVALADEGIFEAMVRSVFAYRRKMLSNALEPFAASRGVAAARLVAQAGLDPRRRPETLDLADLSRLAALFVSGDRTDMV